ncbi:helix-turn-helix domain-containing protein [Streptomyces sp. ADI96-02]|uniref:helix-turn-helix domain-containing protein n=1 Tax=Streptomyces sp. ADI96-02 TaxID=1522760 RepID=UPI000F558B99|nr:helix-turn-helix domain-containing protein [Streptomyces sp. ADI96-02]
MHRLARSGGTPELLRWLSGRADGWAGLVGVDGTVLHAATGPAAGTRTAGPGAPDVAALVAEGVAARAERRARAYSLDTGAHTTLLFPLPVDEGPADPLLAVVTPRPVAAGLATLLADVVLPLALCRRSETVERKRRRVDLAESRGREAVLHLLMTGQLSIAHQVAGALLPRLPDPVRVCVVECSGDGREEVARVCRDADGGRSWIVRCPVYARHLILVTPADAEPDDGPTDEAVAALVGDCVVGVSEQVDLADTATGYRQAFHALAVARELPSRHARFGARPEPALVVGPAGRQWADALLTPLLTHVPRRAQDPGSQELAATATSWLAFSTHARDHLKIHRNTLAARLALIGELLGLDLQRLSDQAALDLALRVRAVPAPACAAGPDPAGAAHDLDEILRRPAVREWADRSLAPLAGAGGGAADTTASGAAPSGAAPSGAADTTLRAWLACEARLGPTATALGISVPGVRKRLTRLETVLKRSLLRPPSARYDLWLAFRARDLGAAGAPRVNAAARGLTS